MSIDDVAKHYEYPILKVGESVTFNGVGWKNEDLENRRVFFIDTEGRLWGTETGNTRCPRKLKKKLKKSGDYEEFMRRDIMGIEVENLNLK